MSGRGMSWKFYGSGMAWEQHRVYNAVVASHVMKAVREHDRAWSVMEAVRLGC